MGSSFISIGSGWPSQMAKRSFPSHTEVCSKKDGARLDTRCALLLLILSPLLHGGCIGGRGCGGQGGPLTSCKQPRAPPPLPAMSHHNKQADFPLSCCQGAMIEARRPLLVFFCISSTMMRPSSSSLLSALAAKTGAGGRSDHSCGCLCHRPRGEGTLWKSKSSPATAPTATSTLTGLHVMD
jgi:hypothetical protein